MSEGDDKNRLAAVRARLEQARGPEYWRCLEELAGSPEFEDLLRRELPQAAAAADGGVHRRDFLRLMGASMALAGVTACTKQPPEKIVPYVRQPEQLVLGKPLYFATAMPFGGSAIGLLVESHEGRPTKIEGNPNHPASLGATDIFAQASVLTLYDPDRSQTLTYLDEIRPWGSFLSEMRTALSAAQAQQGNGLRLLTGSVASPALVDQMQRILAALPGARWHQYEPVNRDGARVGAQMAFGQDVEPVYDLKAADVIVSLDADFLSCGPGNARYLHDFSDRRRLSGGQAAMNRLYVIEGVVSNTGDKADHRLAVRPTQIVVFAERLAVAVGVAQPANVPPVRGPIEANLPAAQVERWIAAIARDLKAHGGTSLVIAGDHQPPHVHALAYAMNAALGNVGKTVSYLDPLPGTAADQLGSLRELVGEMNAGQVATLVIIGANPVYDAPRDLHIEDALAKVRRRVHIGLYRDETAALCHWHVPEAHYLESWSDARAFDGTVSIVQPLIAPLYGGKTAHEIIGAFSDRPGQTSYDIVRAYWKGRAGQQSDADFEKWWRRALNDGVVATSAPPPRAVTIQPDAAGQASGMVSSGPAPAPRASGAAQGDILDIVFRPDPTVWDGRFANNGWLQEIPKPVLRIDWDNVAAISPALAARLGMVSGDLVELKHRGGSVDAPVWVVPGLPDRTVLVYLGYGRTRAGHVGSNIGFDAYKLRRSDSPWFATGLQVRKLGRTYAVATVQQHQLMEGRHLVRAATLDEYRKHPRFAQEEDEAPPRSLTLYPEYKYDGYKWGMSIDLNACTGCSACVAACYAENNIPVVGKDQVSRGRIMHWLRIDRFHKGAADSPEVYHQPVPCMHCEDAPCELVCPVGATVHSPEGLNDMVYNRCVGTRYCSNNCPYKVRRFNFYLYSDWETPSLKLQRNPDVTVRSRGVMEKCTCCVQRINEAKIESEKENRAVRDGEILTACQAACPARAIVFGNINDKASVVAKLKDEPRNYALLGELNTRPRTTYLAAVRNPNPEIE
jgi:molybdopterin-containing oxidoreductase family iron-sulfur binding subunit